MGLFGRKKNKKVADPPAVEEPSTSEVASPDDDVASAAVSEETPYVEHKDEGEAPSAVAGLSDRVTATWASALALWFSLSKTSQVAVMAGAAVGAVGVIALAAAGGRAPAFPAHINVAFVGNSYFYVNDLPRVVEQMGAGHITQDSVIHNQANILQVIMSGNGMWNKWATRSAMATGGVAYETSQGTKYLYDMGACSVPQLLTGVDNSISTGNYLGTFIDDGQNPCFQEDAYRAHQQEKGLNHGWDYVVISDMSKNMVFEDTRELALMAFNYTYGPILKKKNISPIIVQPHAFGSDYGNYGNGDDISQFTAEIMEGAIIYKKYLNKRIGIFAHAHIAPVGNAFLAVYEESPSDIWPKLFLDDGIHPSAYGTFLYGCVIYATMTGHMPAYKRVVVEDMENSDIFATARRLQASDSVAGFPTKDEAAFLYKIAKKVAVRGYKPKNANVSGDITYLRSNDGNDNVYDGEYNNGNDYAANDDQNIYSYMYEEQAAENGNYDYEEDDYQEEGDYENYDYQEEDEDAEENDNADYEEEAYEEQDEQEEQDGGDDTQGNSYNEAADEYFQNHGQNNNNNVEFGSNEQTQFYYSDLSSNNDGE